MNSRQRIFVLISLSIVAIGVVSCKTNISASSVKPEAVGDVLRGYHAEPDDFRGINFKSGEPFGEESLLDALSGVSDVEALEHDLNVLRAMPSDISLRVVGHSDSAECEKKNCVSLSLRRAQLLHDWLIGKGLSADRLGVPKGFGDTRPVGDNETEAGRLRNRRAYVSYEGSD